MSNRLRPPAPETQKQLAPQETPPPVKRAWIVGTLGILLFLALLLSAFSVWVILRPHS